MNALTITPTILYTIKGDAMNKDRARVWIERPLSDLEPYGFVEGMRVDIELNDDGIVVRFNPNGKRKPTLRKKAGKPTKVILDMCMPTAQRDAMFKGSERLTVWASTNTLMVTI